MGLCDSLNGNIPGPCEATAGGVEDKIYIIERKNIDIALLNLAYDASNKVKLNDFPLLAGKKLYMIEGARGSTFVPSSTFSEVGVFTQELHSIEMTVYRSDVKTKWLIELLKNGKFVVIYRNNDGDFEVLGAGAGLVMTAKAYTPTVAETRRSTKLTFASKANQQEPYAPATLLKTDQNTTLAYLESLVYLEPTISPLVLTAITSTVAFSQTLSVVGLSGTLVWGVATRVLPAGLSLNTSTGAITGTPTTAGAYSFVVSVNNGVTIATQAYTGVVA